MRLTGISYRPIIPNEEHIARIAGVSLVISRIWKFRCKRHLRMGSPLVPVQSSRLVRFAAIKWRSAIASRASHLVGYIAHTRTVCNPVTAPASGDARTQIALPLLRCMAHYERCYDVHDVVVEKIIWGKKATRNMSLRVSSWRRDNDRCLVWMCARFWYRLFKVYVLYMCVKAVHDRRVAKAERKHKR